MTPVIPPLDIAACVALMRKVDAALSDVAGPLPNRYCVAGGALRDTLLGRPVKDIDVCIDFFMRKKKVWSRGEPSFHDYTHGGVMEVFDSEIAVDGHPLQFIIRSTEPEPADLRRYHQLYLSDVFWHDGMLSITDGFLADVAAQEIRVKANGRDPTQNERYFEKVRAKYPWPLVFEKSDDFGGLF